ncbi:hypothetical protein Y032_0687g1537 [Ancylostoma ceylanicum]|uniref:Uncharacterized protein n=1 Tax=Ancylostoma ceylanicum TaxID=53326 RepID=A0A016WIS0_9BILA|nr:hypothetical protein Y032_0687g1537 [Ancylostoma ceylanicum]
MINKFLAAKYTTAPLWLPGLRRNSSEHSHPNSSATRRPISSATCQNSSANVSELVRRRIQKIAVSAPAI